MALDTSKIIHAPVGGGRYTVTSPIVKEDYGLYLLIEGLELPSTYEVDFSNSEHNGTSVTMIGNADGVLIPRQFITTGKDVFAFLYHVGADYGRTVYKFRIPNKLRPDRTNEEPTPEEQSVIDQAISALNTAVAQTAQDVIDADASAQSAQGYAEQAESARDTAQTSATQAFASASQASASATASAQSAQSAEQTKTEVEGMVDDAQASASASAQSATASANSASQASGYAQSASASAQSASGYASSAETSAHAASAKASEASASASTASQKASESAQSASQALTYKTDAESAKTASQTAQGLAEQAQTGAETAQGLAEDARDEAQTIVDGISGKVDQIDSNTDRIESLEDDRYKPYAVDAASGAIASFSDGADDLPLKSLVIDINPIQDLSHGDPSPENICPISGWTEVQTNQSGVNVWDEEWESGAFDSDGQKISGVSAICSKNYIPVLPNTTYYYKNGSAVSVSPFEYDANKTFLKRTGYILNQTFTTGENTHYLMIGFPTTYGTIYKNDTSINYPSTDHSYHPYTGRSITIDLGQTVYGGKLDVLSGVMRVNRKIRTVDAISNVTSSYIHSDGVDGYLLDSDIQPRLNPMLQSTQYCNKLKFQAKAIWTSGVSSEPNVFAINQSQIHIKIANNLLGITDYTQETTTTAKEKLNAWLAENPVTLTIPIEPIEIQLTPHEVNSLLGVNNIFADTGDCSVEYRADTTLYISRLTEPDSDMIADANITSGKYFMVGNSLFKATANIASGSAVIVGTNATRKSLSEALNEINA